MEIPLEECTRTRRGIVGEASLVEPYYPWLLEVQISLRLTIDRVFFADSVSATAFSSRVPLSWCTYTIRAGCGETSTSSLLYRVPWKFIPLTLHLSFFLFSLFFTLHSSSVSSSSFFPSRFLLSPIVQSFVHESFAVRRSLSSAKLAWNCSYQVETKNETLLR